MQYVFGDYEFDAEVFELRHGGSQISATPQVLAILQLLLVSRPRVVTKDELVEEIWEGRAITDGAISVRMNALREAIGDSGAEQRIVQTVRGQGFRFVAPVKAETTQSDRPALVEHTRDDPEQSLIGRPTSTRPSVAVLPFLYLGSSDQHEVLQYAFPDELLTQLYKLQWLLVISRGSSFQFASHQHRPSEILERLGARYSVSGSVEVTPKGFVISTELTETISERVIWRDRRSIELKEIYEFRSELAQSIGRELQDSIERNELKTALQAPINSLDSWQSFHIGMHRLDVSPVEGCSEAEGHFRRSLELDPFMFRARAGISQVQFFQLHWGNCEDAAIATQQCLHEAEQAMLENPNDPFCNLAMGRAAVLSRDYSTWRHHIERAVEASPNYSPALSDLARIQAVEGDVVAAKKTLELVEQLDPISLNPESIELTRLTMEMEASEFELAAKRAEAMASYFNLGLNTMGCVLLALHVAGKDREARRIASRMKQSFREQRLRDWFSRTVFKNQDWKAATHSAGKTHGFI